jgi:hypothetical protein
MFHSHSRTRNQLIVLPPAGFRVPRMFRRVEADSQRNSRLLADMQRLRGKAYMEDGAVRAEDLTPDGRHQLSTDVNCWHVLSVDSEDRVTACLRYLDEGAIACFGDLWVSHAALAHCPRAGWKLRLAVERGRARARALHMSFGSVGGWAVAKEQRRTLEPVAIILATYGLLELLGGCVGMATATFRHHSAAILRKIGLSPLDWGGDELPPYFDPQYGCEMEMLQFDSRFPNPKYQEVVKEFSAALSFAPVICREETPILGVKAAARETGAMAAVA